MYCKTILGLYIKLLHVVKKHETKMCTLSEVSSTLSF